MPHARLRCLLGALVALPLLVSCTQGGIEPPSPSEPSLFDASAMRVHPIFSDIKDWTGDGRPDGVEVLLEFQDRFGDPTKAAGTVLFELFEYRRGNPDPRGARVVNPWVGSIATLGEQSAHWNRTSRTYAFQLAFPAIAERNAYVLTATFRPTAGGRFFDRVVLTTPSSTPSEEPARDPAASPSTGG